MADTAEITVLLDAARDGDRGALDRVLATLYQELHTMARRQLAGQHGHTLDATALVHEAYLKLIGRREAQFDDRAHFFALASRMIRRVLIDAARARASAKRGGGAPVAPFDEMLMVSRQPPADVLALDDALNALTRIDRRKAQVVELRFFGGLTVEEAAEVLGVSSETVKRDWKLAKAWLRRELKVK